MMFSLYDTTSQSKLRCSVNTWWHLGNPEVNLGENQVLSSQTRNTWGKVGLVKNQCMPFIRRGDVFETSGNCEALDRIIGWILIKNLYKKYVSETLIYIAASIQELFFNPDSCSSPPHPQHHSQVKSFTVTNKMIRIWSSSCLNCTWNWTDESWAWNRFQPMSFK